MNPASLANLQPAWSRENRPKPGHRYVERMLASGNSAAPHAMKFIVAAMKNEELPMSQRLDLAKYIVDKHWPRAVAEKLPPMSVAAEGADGIDVRFHWPEGYEPPGQAPAVRISFDAE